MKKCIVRALLAALLLGLLAGAQAEPTALDAFYALMAGEDGQAQAASGDDCLDRVMAGEFAARPVDEHELVPEAVERLLEGEGMDGDPALVAHEYRGEVVEEVLDALQVRGGERGRHPASPPLAICPLRKS